jgi:hypothetical protein
MSNLQVPDPGLLAKMQGFLTSPQPPEVLDLQVVAQKNLQGLLISLHQPVFLDLRVGCPGGRCFKTKMKVGGPSFLWPHEQCCGSGIQCLFDPGIRDGLKIRIWIRDEQPDHISESLETIFWVKILKFFDSDPGSGMEKIWIRDKYPEP